MGSGRVGARIALELDDAGHSVAIIDRHTGAFDRLGDDFSGMRVTGSGLHRPVLEKARIEDAYAFAALTNGDNSNIVAARTVSQVYSVKQVVARIYDPERAELYERLGIPTVASVKRTATAVLKRMLPPSAAVVWDDPTGAVALVRIRPNSGWLGVPFATIEAKSGCKIPFVSRLGGTALASSDMVLQENDELFLAQEGLDCASTRRLLSSAPGEKA